MWKNARVGRPHCEVCSFSDRALLVLLLLVLCLCFHAACVMYLHLTSVQVGTLKKPPRPAYCPPAPQVLFYQY